MPRFYLHVVNRTASARDEEGLELADLEAARAEAIRGIRSFIAEEARTGVLDLRGRIEIANEAGEVLEVVPYRDAFELHADGDEA